MAGDLLGKLDSMSCKENLPLRFKDLLSSKTSSSEKLELQRRKYLEAIETYVGSDPLKPWVKCIRWAKDLCTAGVNSELLPLLEICTQKFLNDPRYTEDPRYLRVWIRYADCCSDPLSVFSFMEKKSIGMSHSLFYEAYAVILELRMDFNTADTVYQLGLSRQAQPLAQLQETYKKFLRRKERLPAVTLGTVREEPAKPAVPSGPLPVDHGTTDGSNNATNGVSRYEGRLRPNVPQGDETIAIKKYAEDVLVLGVDPEAETTTETHHGLVDPTINTKEAMANVLSFFSQPLPFEQVRKPRKERPTPLPAAAPTPAPSSSSMNFDVFVDEDCAPEASGTPAGVDPWDDALIDQLLKGLKPSLSTYKGFNHSSKKYNGTVTLAALKSSCRNKSLELGHSTYYIKGCTGQGAFAHVYQAHDDEYDKTVILKVQKPPCPWEFYIYRQLDRRIPAEERSSFGYAWKMHVYSDCSIMVADYGQHGTLQDVINSYLAQGQKMDELLCIYYTIEMLRMLEVLHAQGLIHGDFKPDNLLIRNESEEWIDWGRDRPGCWKDQGLCLIDWGASIDMRLFPNDTKFVGDCKTSAFRCIEMVHGNPWTFQVDTYGLCGIVHCMLHGSYMEIQTNKSSFQGKFQPKAPLKRYWNVPMWESLFKTLLNVKNCESNPDLGPLRRSLEDYMLSDASYARKLKELLKKQTVMMYSRK